MSLLSYHRLVELVQSGVINAKLENINGASIDITLADGIYREQSADGTTWDETSAIWDHPIDLMEKEDIHWESCPSAGRYILEPGEFILASSEEKFNLPNTIACEFKLKSSLARCGLEHLMAGWGDPGWHNSQMTLELKNLTQFHRLALTPGMKIGQIVFWECKEVPKDKSYAAKGQYNNQSGATQTKGLR